MNIANTVWLYVQCIHMHSISHGFTWFPVPTSSSGATRLLKFFRALDPCLSWHGQTLSGKPRPSILQFWLQDSSVTSSRNSSNSKTKKNNARTKILSHVIPDDPIKSEPSFVFAVCPLFVGFRARNHNQITRLIFLVFDCPAYTWFIIQNQKMMISYILEVYQNHWHMISYKNGKFGGTLVHNLSPACWRHSREGCSCPAGWTRSPWGSDPLVSSNMAGRKIPELNGIG